MTSETTPFTPRPSRAAASLKALVRQLASDDEGIVFKAANAILCHHAAAQMLDIVERVETLEARHVNAGAPPPLATAGRMS